MPDVTVTLKFDATNLQADTIPTGIDLINDDGDMGQIATVTSTEQDGQLLLTVTFNRKIYYLQDVAYKMNFSVKAKDTENIGKGDAGMAWDDTLTDQVDITYPVKSPETDDPKTNYALKKELATPYVAGSADIEYLITVTADTAAGGDLAGKRVQDVLPTGLEYTSAVVSVDDADPPTNLMGTAISADFTTLDYTVPTGGAAVGKAVFRVKASLTGDEMAAYMTSQKAYDKKFTNSASLYRAGETETPMHTAAASQVEVKLPIFFDKNGKPSTTDHRLYEWGITVNTYGSCQNSYLIDTVDTEVQSYNKGDGVAVSVEGGAVSTLPIAGPSPLPNDGDGTPVTFERLSNELLKTSYFDDLNIPAGQCGLYTYTDAAGHARQVIIIPYKNYIGKHPVQLGYTTTLKETDPNAQPDKIKNDVKLIWKGYDYGEGEGPDWDDDFDFELNKEYTPDNNLVAKTGAGYDPVTQTLTWKFFVNAYSSDILYLYTTDVFTDAEQDLLDASLTGGLDTGAGATLLLEHVSGNTAKNVEVPYLAPAAVPGTPPTPPADSFYTVLESTDADGAPAHTFALWLHSTGNGGPAVPLGPEDRYTFELKVKVKDPALLGHNHPLGKGLRVENTASTQAAINTPEGPLNVNTQHSTGHQNCTNVLLEKKAGGHYSYADNTLPWHLTINKDHVPITGATLVDTLPKGCVLEAASPVTITMNKGEASQAAVTTTMGQLMATGGYTDAALNDTIKVTQTAATGSDGYAANKFAITFTSASNTLRDCYEIAYHCTVEEKFRSELLLNHDEHRFDNHIAYSAPSKVYGGTVEAEALAHITQKLPPVEKSGTFTTVADGDRKGAGRIHWQVVVNRHRADISGAKIIDDLDPGLFDLDEESFTIKKVVLNAAGAVQASPQTPLDLETHFAGSNCHATGFEVLVPATPAFTDVLLIEFDVYIVDNCAHSQMTNQLTVQRAGKGDMDSGTVTAGGTGDYDYDHYCQGHLAPILNLKKISTNCEGSYQLPLGQAQFKLVRMMKESADPTDDGYVEDPNCKHKGTLSSGKSTFLFLKAGELYMLTETTAPAGYVCNSQPQYLWFEKDGVSPPATINGQAVTVQRFTKSGEMVIENSPIACQSGQPGGLFRAVVTSDALNNNEPIKNTEFTLTHTDPDGNKRVLTATSNDAGLLVFTGLDPNVQYELAEKKLPGYCEAYDKDWEVDVGLDSAGQTFQITVTDWNDDTESADAAPYPIHYPTATGPVVLDGLLEDEDGTPTTTAVPGAEFAIYNGTDKIGYLVWNKTDKRYELSTKNDKKLPKNEYGQRYLRTASGGGLEMLPGDYTYTLTKMPAGYRSDSPATGTFSIDVDGLITLQHLFAIDPNYVPPAAGGDADSPQAGATGGAPATGDHLAGRMQNYAALAVLALAGFGVTGGLWLRAARKGRRRSARGKRHG